MSPAFGGLHSSNIDNSENPFSDVSEDTTKRIDQRIRNTPKHKASHHRFLAWVAYSRKRASNMDDIKRRTCPLIGCEKEFDDQEKMLEHVFTCLCLWDGVYRCASCGQPERISKCYTEGDCRGPHRGKDKLFTVVNSLRLARQFFSHTSKGRPVAERRPTKREILPKRPVELDAHPARSDTGVSELAVDTDTSLNELDTGIDLRNGLHGFVKELQGSVLPTELRGDDEFDWSGHHHLQTGPVELSASYNYTEYPDGQRESTHGPTAIYVSSPIRTAEHTSHHQRIHSWPSSLAYGNESLGGLRVQIPDVEYSTVPHSSDNVQQLYDHAPAVAGPARYYEHINDSDTLARMNVPDSAGHYPAIPPVSPVDSFTSSEYTTGFSSDSMDSILSPLTPSTPTFEENTQAESHTRQPYGIIRDERSGFDTFESMPKSGIPFHATFELGDCSFGRSVAYTEHAQAHLMQHPTAHDFQRSEMRFSPMPSSIESSHGASTTELSTPALPHYCESDYQCSDCGYKPSGKEINKKSNLKRHRKKSCRRFSPYSPNDKTHKCTYRDCGRRFTRSDNLLVHRRKKAHYEIFELGANVPPSQIDPKTIPEMFGEAHDVADWGILGEKEWSEVMLRSY